MRAMMRVKSGIFLALTTTASLIVACSWGGSGNGDPHPDASTAHAVCGDGTCSASEVNNCPADCGSGGGSNQNAVCGNNSCETTKGETAQSCPSDCAQQGSGSGSGSGTGMCPSDPTQCLGCIIDPTMCPTGLDQNACIACIFGGGSGMGCVGGIPDGTCDMAGGETNANCPLDCP